MFKGLLTAAFVAALTGCATPRSLPTVAQVDLRRYSGKWFEVARLKNRFQRNNERAIAEYEPLGATAVRVRNTAIGPGGKTRGIEGRAEVVPGSEGARLRVRFQGFAALAPVSSSGNYWIIALDAQYQSAMVGTPDRCYLWILSRQPALSDEAFRRYVAEASRLGFPTENIIRDQDIAVK